MDQILAIKRTPQYLSYFNFNSKLTPAESLKLLQQTQYKVRTSDAANKEAPDRRFNKKNISKGVEKKVKMGLMSKKNKKKRRKVLQ